MFTEWWNIKLLINMKCNFTINSWLSYLHVNYLQEKNANSKSAFVCHPACIWGPSSCCQLDCVQELQIDFNVSLWKKNMIMVVNLLESYNEFKTQHECFLDYVSLGITYTLISSMTVDNWTLAILLQLKVLMLRKWTM